MDGLLNLGDARRRGHSGFDSIEKRVENSMLANDVGRTIRSQGNRIPDRVLRFGLRGVPDRILRNSRWSRGFSILCSHEPGA